jgi:hypothetical protein
MFHFRHAFNLLLTSLLMLLKLIKSQYVFKVTALKPVSRVSPSIFSPATYSYLKLELNRIFQSEMVYL